MVVDKDMCRISTCQIRPVGDQITSCFSNHEALLPKNLIQEFRNFFVSAMQSGCEAAPHIPAILAGIDRCAEPRRPEPRSLGTVDLRLDEALRLGRGHRHDALLDVIASCRQALVWNSSESAYGDLPKYRHFLDNYAFTVLVGPAQHGLESLYHDSALLCGLTIQAPGIYYPAHAHPAIEIYAVAGGTARWLRGKEGWTPRPPGSVILHESGVAHALETGDEPTLALFAWVSDLDQRPYMVEI